jgi:hypothetical protein
MSTLDQLDIPLAHDSFTNNLVGHLAETLQDVVGLQDALGFISVVGQKVGEDINERYRHALGVNLLNEEQVAEVMVDLKRRIAGDFYIIEQTADKIVLGNRACPFGAKVIGRPSLCMMTSNVVGLIAAENLGYAKVALEEPSAQGQDNCRVVVYLQHTAESTAADGNEYYRG